MYVHPLWVHKTYPLRRVRYTYKGKWPELVSETMLQEELTSTSCPLTSMCTGSEYSTKWICASLFLLFYFHEQFCSNVLYLAWLSLNGISLYWMSLFLCWARAEFRKAFFILFRCFSVVFHYVFYNSFDTFRPPRFYCWCTNFPAITLDPLVPSTLPTYFLLFLC